MQNISEAAKNWLAGGGAIGVTIAVSGIDGELSLSGADITENSLTVDRNSVSGKNVEIGNAETSELSFVLNNSDFRFSSYRFEGSSMTVTLDINGEPLKAGVFVVDEPPKKLTTLQIKALDHMARFNRDYDTDLAYPATLFQIVQDACVKCGVTLYTMSFLHADYLVAIRPTVESLTYHQVLIWAAQLAGVNAWIDWDGQLRLSWYAQTDIEITPAQRFSFQAAESDITISGITATIDDITYAAGTDDYSLLIEDNGLLQSNAQDVIDALYLAVGGFAYRPYAFDVKGSPHFWPLDILERIIDPEGNELSSIITSHKYQLGGNSKIKAVGETAAIKGYATAAPFTAKQSAILQQIAKAEASRQTTSLELATLDLNQIMSNSIGFYATVITDPGNGAKTQYIHNLPVLDESDIIYTMTASGFAWTDGGWNGGTPVWQYGYTASGNAILKVLTATGIVADWIQAGELRSATGRISFGLDTEIFRLGEHILDILSGTLKFTSSQRDDSIDYAFMRDGGDKANVLVDGTLETTEALSWGGCRAERRDDAGNKGIDFVF